ncbi:MULTISPECIES: hypothetical protein [unclassified Streptomyces]|uniref:hypothetical protein n=1 Tax=unclassified Streptomyces TaxID=2593676 RepID=UPI0036FAA3DA
MTDDGETVTVVRTRLKMAATLTVVVLALTGFQTSSGGGKGGSGGSGKSKSKSSGGGGCSSDKKDNDDYEGSGSGSGSSGSDGEYGYTAEPTSSATASGAVTVVDCVKPAQKKRKGRPARKADTTATVRITSEARYDVTELYKVTLSFKGASGSVVDTRTTTLRVEHGEEKDFEVEMANPRLVDKVKRCEVRVEEMNAY